MKQRVSGFDVARALAIFGMVIVNFKVVMGAATGHAGLATFAQLFEGRASALFVILAGIGVTFLTNKARHSKDQTLILKSRLSLIKRGALLVVIGLAYTPIWEADILHFYGFYFLVAALVATLKDKRLLLVALAIMLSFPMLMLVFNYEQNWDWATLTYQNLWTLDGMVRHILFNGFHPVFPWAAYLVFGMWLGRQDLSNNATKLRLLSMAVIVLLITEGTFYFFRFAIGDGSSVEMTAEEVSFLFSTSIIPPLPQYLLSAGSSAVIVLIACLYFSEKFATNKINKYLCQTGQLSLTLYVAHIIIGMGTLEAIGRLENQSINFAVTSATVFFVSGIVFSVIWLKYFSAGPLEWLFRKLVK